MRPEVRTERVVQATEGVRPGLQRVHGVAADAHDLGFPAGVALLERVQGGRFAADADVLRHSADFQLDVRGRRGINEQLQPGLHVMRESARRYGQGVSARRYGQNAKVALRSGRYGALNGGLRVGEHHGGVWDRASAWVRDRALQ